MITPPIEVGIKPARRDPQTFAIIGAAMAVHGELGGGFLETVYQEALAIELKNVGIPFVREHCFPIEYRGIRLNSTYRCDFLCFGQIIVELKAIREITNIDEAQAINYLKASKLTRALILNFANRSLEHKRLVLESASFSPLRNLRESA